MTEGYLSIDTSGLIINRDFTDKDELIDLLLEYLGDEFVAYTVVYKVGWYYEPDEVYYHFSCNGKSENDRILDLYTRMFEEGYSKDNAMDIFWEVYDDEDPENCEVCGRTLK